ncbi:hypothetical protein GR167_02880 [Rhodobacteraceae bacterium GS-10]|uniref:Calcium-binding protein n=1 Tax=Thalassovita mangrovi TaxID=2692236 RepID=A0A6L8LEJ9_9RHOB|nr:hypothetical protein [Thalassovita mangrovi]
MVSAIDLDEDEVVSADSGEDKGADDEIEGSAGADSLIGGAGEDVLLGRGGADSLLGYGGDDLLKGGDGDDVMDAGAGDDDLRGGDGIDIMFGGAGDDLMDGGADSDYMEGGSGADTMDGGAGDDVLFSYWSPSAASGGYDLQDSYDPDLVRGGDGIDILMGGSGDTLEGGDGTDGFVTGTWVDPDHAVEIADFEAGDQIVVTQFDNYTGAGEVELETDGDDVTVLFDGSAVARVTNGAGVVSLADVSVIEVDAPA